MGEDNQQQQSAMPYQVPMHNFGSNILFLTNPKSTLYKLELSFRNMMEKDDGVIIPVGDPLMNEDGISSVLGQMQSIVNQVNILGNLNKEEIPNLMNYFSDSLAKDLMLNRKHYEINEASSRDKIFMMATALVFVTCKRAYEQGDRIFFGKTTQEVHQSISNDSKRGGILGALNPWKRNN